MGHKSTLSTVVIVAGETSGDLHGAKLVDALQARTDRLRFHGVGGPALRCAGVRILVDAAALSVVGVTEVVAKLPAILNALKTVKGHLKKLKPDLLILIDFPDFNLNLAVAAKKMGIPVLYYISPQIWAWRPGRVKRIARLVDHMAVILPFEEEFYKNYHVPVTFIGHPLLDNPLPASDAAFNKPNGGQPVVGLLPGSREGEIIRHVPVMLVAAGILKTRFSRLKFLISHAPSVRREQLELLVNKNLPDIDLEIFSSPVEEMFQHCSILIAASGTVTLQAAIHGMPMVIIYKVSPLNYLLGRALIRVKNIGLVNLIAANEIVPELIQYDATPANIADAASEIISDSAKRRHMRNELVKVRDRLGRPGASERLADIALQMIG
jgi:lipid-A-disaccharide synthase